MVLLIFILT